MTLSVPYACQREVFNAAYVLRKTSQNVRYFVPRSGCEKIIVNMVDSDHGMQDTEIRVIDPLETESANMITVLTKNVIFLSLYRIVIMIAVLFIRTGTMIAKFTKCPIFESF